MIYQANPGAIETVVVVTSAAETVVDVSSCVHCGHDVCLVGARWVHDRNNALRCPPRHSWVR